MRGPLYARLKNYCERKRVPMAYVVDMLLSGLLDAECEPDAVLPPASPQNRWGFIASGVWRF